MEKKYTFDDCKLYLREIKISTPRAGIIIAVELLTVLLKDILEGAIITNPGEDNVLQALSFGPTIDFAYRIGAINRNEYDVLQIIKRLRHEYAHGLQIKDPKHAENLIKLCQELIDSKWCQQETKLVRPQKVTTFPETDFLTIMLNLCYRFTAYVITEKIKLKWTYTKYHKEYMSKFIEAQLKEHRKMSKDAECILVTNRTQIAVLKFLRKCHICHKSNLAVVSSSASSEQFIRDIENSLTRGELTDEIIEEIKEKLEKHSIDPIECIKFMCSKCDKIYKVAISDYNTVYKDELP